MRISPGLSGRDAVLGLVLLVLFSAILWRGAYQPLSAMGLAAASGACLVAALWREDLRAGLAGVGPVAPLAGLFLAVVGVALLTLTAWTPGGPNPVWAWAGLPGASTMDRSATNLEIIKLFGLASLFVLGCLFGARREDAGRVFAALLCVGAAYAMVSLLIYLFALQAGRGGGRLLGGFDSPNCAATLMGSLLVLATGWTLRGWRRSRGRRVTERLTDLSPALAGVLLFLACLLLTASRAGAVCAFAAVIGLLAWEGVGARRTALPTLAVGAGVVAAATALLLMGSTIMVARFGQVGPGANDRSVILAAHWEAFLRSPLFGYGLGTYNTVNSQIMTADTFAPLAGTSMLHNTYVQWLEEAGLIGAVPMFALVAFILVVTLWRALRRRSDRTLLGSLLMISLLVCAHASVDVPLQMPAFAGLWAFVLGLGYAWSQGSVRRGGGRA